MPKNTTFVLGAGFSVDATDPQMPLARELRERVLRFIEFERHSSYAPHLDKSWEYPQGQFRAGLQQIDPDGHLQFEELFTEFRRQGVTSDSEGPAYVAEWVLRIGCARLFWCLHGLNPFPEWCYKNFASRLAQPGSRNTVISFNWDIVAETALVESRIPWSYSLYDPAIVPILKPHGSINWNSYLRRGFQNDSGLWRPIGPGSGLSYPAVTPLENPFQQGINPDLVYALFPGDPDLPEHDEDLKRIWEEAKIALQGSDRVVFIGYSLPDYDPFASTFFHEHVSSEVEVYNPSEADRQKYKQLFGGRIVQEGGRFSSSPYAASAA
ncbi:MAG: hypothetical protein ABSF71_10105 [Terriglobia bacterium]|jgi:hypothetical protein